MDISIFFKGQQLNRKQKLTMGWGSNQPQEMEVAAQQWDKKVESERFSKSQGRYRHGLFSASLSPLLPECSLYVVPIRCFSNSPIRKEALSIAALGKNVSVNG
jgi:hypothetical protein